MRFLLKYRFIFLCLAVIGCEPKQHMSIKQKQPTSKSYNRNHSIDTLREPTHYYYLADISPKVIAELILNDSIEPTDNFITFRIMDSISSINNADRQFYLKAFNNIMEKADGALAEAIGSPAQAYIEQYTKEFFEMKPPLTKAQFNKWADNVGIEIYLSSNNDEKVNAEKFINLINSNCSGCSSKTKRKIKEFCHQMQESIDNVKE